ncbi:DUF2789 domain-containing protein [Aliikangiella coralliicola]|uniref:DUF2789 domain-containing protein n=2 Tax=Aliikangiella coralliicola TaxID=2592383 RepID=A0A545UCP4_9GAMM|nr:DUF2789 domain-containing protein [Aliikangiella coralliicola]
MEQPIHNLISLFNQLGLDSSDEAIKDFIGRNKPIPDDVELHNADFWNVSQSSFLKQVIDDDADWAEVVDQLNVMLR